MIIVELLEPAGDRGFLPESDYHDYAGRDINAAMCAALRAPRL